MVPNKTRAVHVRVHTYTPYFYGRFFRLNFYSAVKTRIFKNSKNSSFRQQRRNTHRDVHIVVQQIHAYIFVLKTL